MPAPLGSIGSCVSFGMHYKEMCLTYEEFAALLGSDSKRAPVAASIGNGFFRSSMRMLGLFVVEARELVADDRVDLAGFIERYLDPLDFEDLERQIFKTQALVFCLGSTRVLTSPVGWGGSGSGRFGSPNGVWLSDHLKVVEPPRHCPYEPSQYQSRRGVVRLGLEDEWLQWLLALRPDQILCRYDWYETRRFLIRSAGYQMAYLLGMDSITFYPSSRLGLMWLRLELPGARLLLTRLGGWLSTVIGKERTLTRKVDARLQAVIETTLDSA
ncbi:hypothetical protein JCGZ_17486 [Jatropha curcas]|uniref:Uncharacterized protein n=1 Tax=Jatropha curcas TaxID=180498 RepID=A0A067KEQ9_JATCU|nr:hypothetical protein JCGZ_17486 [Jatropha curcas]